MKRVAALLAGGALTFGATACDSPARPEVGASVSVPSVIPRLSECAPNEHDESEGYFYPSASPEENQDTYMQRLASHLPIGPVIFFEASATCKMQDAKPLLPSMFFESTPDTYTPMDLHISGTLEDGTIVEADCVLGGIAGSIKGDQLETFEPVIEKGRQTVTVVCNDDSSQNVMTGPNLPAGTN
ncbi:MAG TPA: hypothetical protein PKD15_04150 [Candidatus Saccharibacteria bacterium]|jgi:hypothetical protein|nr:hypothetical protein [Candidatus Saccharibacteria bacterium]